ncbi:ABC transporter ATP-binding protein [Paraliobacillus sediminis]|uniref:ABC transporter ATP-binding protein n=1 Tax=Paraliobacillus sediminis TaxID=1885916 RepID=UPI000E3ED5CF|nr:ABC transporter ATP-binding protein [Paraliobacillus sediminis]
MPHITEVENLRLKFPGGSSLLFKDLSLSFKKGEKVLLLGPSGSGKSTLLQVLTGLIPNSIEIAMKADKIDTPNSWGYLFQDPDTQFCMPYVDEELAFVLENLQIPRAEMKTLMRNYLSQVGLSFDDLHTNIKTLSGGMKQRLALACVLALEPEVLFLDEPTAMLDPEGTKAVWDTIKKTEKDRTFIIVEHKIDHIIDIVDRVVILNETGKIIADGSSHDIFKAYKHLLIEQGIWYPEVWQDYLRKTKKVNPTIDENSNQAPALSLQNFTGYRGKTKKIEVDNLAVYPGEWIAVVGENGAGKSTLLHGLIQLIKTKGVYEIFDIDNRKVERMTDYISFVFQNPELQFITNATYDEIAYTLKLEKWSEDKIKERVTTLLNIFHLHHVQQNHPYQLSMGQKRRLSVAASIVNNQPILLLDEPTFGQDAKNTFSILEQLEDLRKTGSTIIMVTHDQQIVDHFASRVWTVKDGKLVEDRKVRTSIKQSRAL